MIRTLLVTGDWPPALSGVGDYTARLATSLHEAGAQVSVLTTRRRGLLRPPGLEVLTTPDWKLRRAPRLRAIFNSFDVVHVQYPAIAYGRRPLVNLLPMLSGRARSVVTIHDFRVMRRRWQLRTLPMLLTADTVACVDAGDTNPISGWSRRPTDCMPIASNIDIEPTTSDALETLRSKLGIGSAEFVVAFFGILYPHKGLPELISAVHSLRQRYALRLLVIGDFDREADWRPELERRLADPCVVWARGADAAQVSRLLQLADAAALPFHTGAASNRSSLLTALLHGLPTVTTRGPATPAGFERDFPCLLVPPRDTVALERQLASLIDAPAACSRLAAEASARGARLCWSAVAAQHLALYERTLNPVATFAGARRESA